MKKITTYLMLLVCGLFISTALTSCIDDDDDSTGTAIDEATQKSYINTISYNSPFYSKARFYYSKSYTTGTSYTVKYDSISSVRTYFRTDSTFLVNDFPVCKLDSCIQVSETQTSGVARELFDAIHNSTTTTKLYGSYWVPTTGYVTNDYLMFLQTAFVETELTYGGATHNVAFYFAPLYGTSPISYGLYNRSKFSCQYQLYLYRIYIDYVSPTNPGTQFTTNFTPILISFT